MSFSRREFLFYRPASTVGAENIVGADLPGPDRLVPENSRPAHPEQGSLTTVSREAMAGEFEVDVNTGQYEHASEAILNALDEVTRLEDVLSFFRPKSKISYINAVAAYEPVSVDDELFEVLRLCLNLERETEGAIDITATPLWKIWGFAKREGRVPDQGEIDTALELVGSRHVILDEHHRTVRFSKPGVAINLGCVGKGFALDKAGQKLREAEVNDFLMHGGLSSVLAFGAQRFSSLQQDTRGGGWKIGVAHPMEPGRRLTEIRLQNSAIGTSGTQHQYFRHRGKRYGHILDPRSGVPAQGVVSVTVIAPDAARADAFSTAFFVMGVEKTEAFCSKHKELSVIMTIESDKGRGYDTVFINQRQCHVDTKKTGSIVAPDGAVPECF